MASKAVADAINAYLAAHWTTTAILSEDAEETPADGSAYVEAQFYPSSRNERLAIDRQLIREQGHIRLVIAAPRGAGAADLIRTHGAALNILFCGVDIAAADGTVIHCLVPSEPVTDDGSKDGNFVCGAFVIPFWRAVDRG